MEIREPKFKIGDYVTDRLGFAGRVENILLYRFSDRNYIYDVSPLDKKGNWREFDESRLVPYVEKPKTIWDLQNGDTYYVVDYNDMNAFKIVFYNDEIDLNHRELGNCFFTKEEAESELERVKIEAEMLRLGGRRKFKFDGDNYGIFYCEGINVVLCHLTMYQGSIYFDTRKEVEDAIKTIGEDRIRKYIFGVD